MKKILLAGTALVGATMLASGAQAQEAMMAPSIGDKMSVSIGGNLRVSYLIFDQDSDSPGVGDKFRGRERGYRIASDDSEIVFKASNTADNGLSYGFNVEVNSQTNAEGNADETWMFIDGGDTWGRVEMGDQDSAGDRIFIGGEDAPAGRGGYDGAVGDVFNFENTRLSGPTFNMTSDATKIIYFTPRFGGFEFGASFTPDSGHNGGAGISDDNGGKEIEDVLSVGVSFKNTFNDITVSAALAGEFGEIEDAVKRDDDNDDIVLDGTPADNIPEVISGRSVSRYGGGLKLDYAGFSVAGGYVEQENMGFDGSDDRFASFGINYTTGPWKVGGGYFFSETDNEKNDDVQNPDETEVNIFSIGANYNVAPGFEIATDINFVEEDKINKGNGGEGDSNDGTVFVLSTIMSF